MVSHGVSDEVGDLFLEYLQIELQRMLANRLRVELLLRGFKVKDGFFQAGRRLLVEEYPGGIVDHRLIREEPANRLQSAAGTIGNHRTAETLCFDRDDSKVLFSRKQQRSASGEILPQFAIACLAKERHRGSSHLAQLLQFTPTANDAQLLA